MATAEEYATQKERTAALTNLTLASTDGTATRPTPTQEENDQFALGLIGPDDKTPPPTEKAMPPVGAQQAYLRDGTALPTAPAPTAARTTTTTATRTTSTSTPAA